ncbi:helix-turn-helix domain-containing protein [Agilicoccus flavus]|uniref:helix-turn-helix domain-containing protein n=1 Tax=Agilicoccus flavus TaxID=2775968 RepID=UPI001CF68BC2|nr:helix-turn-helix domain-containing protein [Agilicoccus flavus]
MSEAMHEFVVAGVDDLPGVVSMVGYRSFGLPVGVHLGVPSGTVTFILSLDGPVLGADCAADVAGGRLDRADVLLAGLHDTATHVVQPARQEGVQLALDPRAARALFGLPAAELPQGIGDALSVDPRWRRLLEAVGETSDWGRRFALVAGEVRRRAAEERSGPRPETAHAWTLLARSRGTAGIDDVARAVALSGRQLRAEFRREYGVGPKQAARLMRFEHATARLAAAVRAGAVPSLAEVAADCGYADQSHLARDVRGYLGLAPSAWLSQERRNIQAGGHSQRREWAT